MNIAGKSSTVIHVEFNFFQDRKENRRGVWTAADEETERSSDITAEFLSLL